MLPATWEYNAEQNAIACPTNYDGITGFIDSRSDFDNIEFEVTASPMDGDDDALGTFINTTGTKDNLSTYMFFMEAGGWKTQTDPTKIWSSPGIVSALQQKGSASGLYRIDNKSLSIQNMELVSLPCDENLYWDTNGDTNIHVIATKEKIQIYVNDILQIDYALDTESPSHGSFGFFTSSQPVYFKDVHYTATFVTYNLSFDANLDGAQIIGDTDISGISTKTWNKDLPIAEHSAYKFLEWNTKPDGTGENMSDSITKGAPVNIAQDTTLYAQWEKIPFPIEATPDNNGYGSATVAWPSYDYRNKNFKVYQSADGGNTWSSIGIDYRDVEEVRCLQIYPTETYKGQLKTWMEENGYGKGIIKIDEISIDSYNADPDGCLKDNSGNYKYDVIFFGTADSNASKDLTETSLEATVRFIKAGAGRYSDMIH